MGDTAVAVHPEDERPCPSRGQKCCILPLLDKPIPWWRTEYVTRNSGPGRRQIRPAHDPNDFEAWRPASDLPIIRVLTDDGLR